MTPLFWALVCIVSSCETLSIGIAKQNVKKRETDIKNFFPDWVPFRNGNGEIIEELVNVEKSKPKKRLAHPKNFVLKSVAEPQDDYYLSQGDSDNEDYYEKKEWADLHRDAKNVDAKTPTNQANISDIDSIVNIITKPKEDPVLRVLKARSRKSKEDAKPKEVTKRQNVEERSEENSSQQEKESESKESKENKVDDKSKKDSKKSGEEDYEEESSEKKKTDEEIAKEEEQKQSEEKKKKLLESVDALKERHATEQRSISEKLKEEEIHKDELERDNINPRENTDKYAQDGTRWKKLSHEYEEYESQDPVVNDKYKINPLKTKSATSTSTKSPKTKEKRKQKKTNKTVASGKLSVFRHPQLYMVNDEEDASSTTKTTEKPTEQTATRSRKPHKFSSRFSESSKPEEDNVRISLVPEDVSSSREGEPALFFPKVKKSRSKYKNKATTPVPDSTAVSSEDKRKSSEVTGPDSDTAAVNVTEADITAPSAGDADSSASNTAITESQSAPTAIAAPLEVAAPLAIAPAPLAVDSVQAGTHKEEQKKNEDFHRETGSGKDHSSEHDEIHDEHGKKAYEGIHKDTKSNKGHHDKANHLDKYHDHGGIDKSHHDEDNHYGSHHHEEHGKKHAKYEESGKHSKGHSTKGSHDIHKKEEYEKKVEFFEEEGDSDDEEFDGGHSSKKEHSSGGHFKKGQHHSSHGGHSKGEKGDFAKGGHGHHDKGHKSSEGHDSHGEHGDRHHEDAGKKGGRKWVYHKGSPSKGARLAPAPRPYGYVHGPVYFG